MWVWTNQLLSCSFYSLGNESPERNRGLPRDTAPPQPKTAGARRQVYLECLGAGSLLGTNFHAGNPRGCSPHGPESGWQYDLCWRARGGEAKPSEADPRAPSLSLQGEEGLGGAIWPSWFSSLSGHSRPGRRGPGTAAPGLRLLLVRDHLPWETSYLSSTQSHPGRSCRHRGGAGVAGRGAVLALAFYHTIHLPSLPLPSPPPPLSKMPTKPRLPCRLPAGLSGLQEHLVGRQQWTSAQPTKPNRPSFEGPVGL